MNSRKRRQITGLCVLGAILIALVIVRLFIYRPLQGGVVFSWPDELVREFRFTAVGVAIMTGAALAVSGVLLQALLRNPLASPFILGISSGAALGVMIALYCGAAFGWMFLRTSNNALAALAGALAVLGIVYVLGKRRGWLDPLSLVLTGVVVSAICGALILLLQSLAPHPLLRSELIVWMMGRIDEGAGAGSLMLVALITIVCLAASAMMGRAMDAATLVEDEARSVGVSIGRLRLIMFVMAGALAAISVTLCGPISFVGLIAPHAARLLIGPKHTMLVFASALAGAALLLAADVASQAISVGGGRVPVGVFTALIGGPAFIWLLRSGKGQV